MSIKESEIRQHFNTYLDRDIPFEREVYFRQNDFISPQSEESLASIIGKKSAFESETLFWVKAYQQIGKWEEVLEEWEHFTPEMFLVQPKKINQASFSKAIKAVCINLPEPPELLSPPSKAYQLKDVWNQRIFLLENEERYQLVYWDTTA